MKKKGFTLVEILTALVVLAVLVSISVAAYQKTVQFNEDKICKENQKVLKTAIDIYTMENNALPATLSLISPQQIYLAYQKVTNGRSKTNSLLARLADFLKAKTAIAGDLGKYYGNNPKVLKCPSDKSSSSESYTMNTSVFSSKDAYTNSANANTAVIYDADNYHERTLSSQTYQIGITPAGTVGEQVLDANKNVLSDSILIPDPIVTVGSNCSTAADCCPRPNNNECKHRCKDAGFSWRGSDHGCVTCSNYSNETDCEDSEGCEWEHGSCRHDDD